MLNVALPESQRKNELWIPSFDMRDQEALEVMLDNMQSLKEVVESLHGRVDVRVEHYQ